MPSVDTFVQDLRIYIKKEDEKPLLGPSFSKSVLKGFVKALKEKYQLSREDLEFFYAHMGEAEAHGEPVFDMVQEYATTPERQEKIRENIKTWCEKFSAAQEGGYRVAMGIDHGVQVDLA